MKKLEFNLNLMIIIVIQRVVNKKMKKIKKKKKAKKIQKMKKLKKIFF